MQFAGPDDNLQVFADRRDARIDHAPVELDLRFAWAAEEPITAALALQ
ncbi:unnamed protein product, partial [marine sediment metagenome]